ncbi:MAG: helix-turn-helix transcriptional regulator [Bdellovibrionaceae bacterium]|nr:helix-turn-helix transcriptional regulator [Pseudobdellovibrionaceae bacterium]
MKRSGGGLLKAVRRLFSRNMKRLRRKMGYSQEDLAEKMDVSSRYIQQLEGKNCPSVGLDVVAKVSRALRAKPRDFFEE